ncbi:unnamed protein product [Rotaria socialis]|uniref:Uncharacterized protein n=1 Tax=Rotaria socialis TaxID=392032 RepID=A0A818YYP9_9BILA|nr:unnamed protein product [Rotaria socialis]CAF3325010.1 unnamed protein product [Rotaria socialis]CAF3329200.1 unnamed protein product [Rotaria socialis]CAF3757488.1 unnamed protein product [Rotaria socialis]CAF4502685.1 unnamed protein product [Rotaria socialis]
MVDPWKLKAADWKLIAVILVMEILSFVCQIIHMTGQETDMYNNFVETPTRSYINTTNYYCFKAVNHCHFNSDHLRFPNIFHVLLSIIGIGTYSFLFYIVFKKRYDMKCLCSTHLLYNYLKPIAMLTAFSNCVILGVLFEAEYKKIIECTKVSILVRWENLLSYLVINVMELIYVYSDLAARAATPEETMGLNQSPT